jgi:hypothetical protein
MSTAYKGEYHMQFTTSIRNITVLACFSLIVIGKFEHLDDFARSIVSEIQDVQIVLAVVGIVFAPRTRHPRRAGPV